MGALDAMNQAENAPLFYNVRMSLAMTRKLLLLAALLAPLPCYAQDAPVTLTCVMQDTKGDHLIYTLGVLFSPSPLYGTLEELSFQDNDKVITHVNHPLWTMNQAPNGVATIVPQLTPEWAIVTMPAGTTPKYSSFLMHRGIFAGSGECFVNGGSL
jgi:hypothetical protein